MTSTNPKPAGKASKKAVAAKSNSDNRRLEVPAEPGKSHERMMADLVTRGVAMNALTALRYVRPELGEPGLTELAASLRDDGAAINAGDLSGSERMLHAQAVSLNAIFCELARRSHANMGGHIEVMESYMRLAIRAQSQCRATLETLAAIKNPPIVYARQMNVANGPQQVNNATKGGDGGSAARTGKIENRPNELLEGVTDGSEKVDRHATATAGRKDQDLVTLGARDRPTN